MNSQSGDFLRHDPAGATEPERVDLVMSDGAVIRLRKYAGRRNARLVMSHGNGMAINAYAPFWKLFAGEYELVIFDVRNHGENPVHPEGHDWDRFADDFEEIFSSISDRFGSMPTIGVFHSLSSIAAVIQVNKYGRRWDGIVLFDPPILPPA
jgi:pimeloyl-ACP methyl ester carboxylesterase